MPARTWRYDKAGAKCVVVWMRLPRIFNKAFGAELV